MLELADIEDILINIKIAIDKRNNSFFFLKYFSLEILITSFGFFCKLILLNEKKFFEKIGVLKFSPTQRFWVL